MPLVRVGANRLTAHGLARCARSPGQAQSHLFARCARSRPSLASLVRPGNPDHTCSLAALAHGVVGVLEYHRCILADDADNSAARRDWGPPRHTWQIASARASAASAGRGMSVRQSKRATIAATCDFAAV